MLSSQPDRPASEQSAAAAAREVLVRSGSSFGAAFVFLDKERRQALDAVYAYCRLVDDAVDDAPDAAAARAELSAWRVRLDRLAAGGASDEPGPAGEVERALHGALARFPIRAADLGAILEGCEWDLGHHRYATWDELREYCLRVASAVGLCCIEIFGYREPKTRDYAIDLGLALQLTNIVRDVDEDGARGRIYLPLADLAAFGVPERDLLEGRRSEARARLMRFSAQRARLYFERARAAISAAQRRDLVAAEIMGDIYSVLLDRIIAEGFPARRVRLSRARKAAIALGRYARSKLPV